MIGKAIPSQENKELNHRYNFIVTKTIPLIGKAILSQENEVKPAA